MTENTIDKRIAHLESLLKSIKLCTRPIDNHSDPKSINDCWDEVEDSIASIKSAAKGNVFYTWKTAMKRSINENESNYDKVSNLLETSNFKYLPEDNTKF